MGHSALSSLRRRILGSEVGLPQDHVLTVLFRMRQKEFRGTMTRRGSTISRTEHRYCRLQTVPWFGSLAVRLCSVFVSLVGLWCVAMIRLHTVHP